MHTGDRISQAFLLNCKSCSLWQTFNLKPELIRKNQKIAFLQLGRHLTRLLLFICGSNIIKYNWLHSGLTTNAILQKWNKRLIEFYIRKGKLNFLHCMLSPVYLAMHIALSQQRSRARGAGSTEKCTFKCKNNLHQFGFSKN